MSVIPPLRLGVNVDHVATLRNARGGRVPDPVRAALLAIEAGADDAVCDDVHTVTCAFENIGEVSSALAAKFGDAETVKIVWKPNVMAPVDFEKAESLMKLVDVLDEDDDVQNVFTNADIPDDVMEKLNV